MIIYIDLAKTEYLPRPVKVGVFYFKLTRPGTTGNIPVFFTAFKDEDHFYGMPAIEFPNLVKVSKA